MRRKRFESKILAVAIVNEFGKSFGSSGGGESSRVPGDVMVNQMMGAT